MGPLAVGEVVLVRFPFSDLSQSKRRPAVVLADAGRGDRILCQVTSKRYGDASAIELDQTAFASGSLRVTSYARPVLPDFLQHGPDGGGPKVCPSRTTARRTRFLAWDNA